MKLSNVLYFIFFIFLLLSCTSEEKPVQQEVTINKKTNKSAGYKFSYSPYEKADVSDKEAYNYIFNIIRNRLVYYVEKSLPVYPDLIGIVFELKVEGHKSGFEELMKSPIIRGWSVFNTDVIPLADKDIEGINNDFSPEAISQAPKANFYIKLNGNNCVVYVRYWILQLHNYNFIYYLEKRQKWITVKAEILN